MKIIRTGQTRLVILVKSYAIKIPYFTRGFRMLIIGINANRTERKIWRRSKDEHLFPVILSSFTGLFLVMPRAEKTCDGEDEKIYLPGYKFLGGDESCNYGYLKGKICKLDYAESKLAEKI